MKAVILTYDHKHKGNCAMASIILSKKDKHTDPSCWSWLDV